MSSAKWSGIEQKKYGLTARWYVSAKYGYATDEGGWGLYDPVSNVDGWGGKKRPFDGLDTFTTNKNADGWCVIDSGKYKATIPGATSMIVGDGSVVIEQSALGISSPSGIFKNCTLINCTEGSTASYLNLEDVVVMFSTLSGRNLRKISNCIFYDSSFGQYSSQINELSEEISNSIFVRFSGTIASHTFRNNIIINSPGLRFSLPALRPIAKFQDYSVIIGTVNGRTLEDFKAEGQYFHKSFSEVDLFGNASGSGASVAQLNTIFNNFFYPYIDDWQYLDLSLRPDVDDRVRYGGLNGHFIGALPVGYHFDIPTLWNTYKDAGNTTNVELNMSDKLIRTNPAIPGVYTSTTITLPNVIDETDVAMFLKNSVYDSNGVAVQRLDYSVDPAKDNTLEQRTVYSYRMKTSPDDVTPLTDWKEYELDRAPTVDASGNSNIDDLFDSETETKQPIKRFIIEITLRSE